MSMKIFNSNVCKPGHKRILQALYLEKYEHTYIHNIGSALDNVGT